MRKPIGKIKDPSKARRTRRKLSIRKKVFGNAERPRMNVTKSNKNLFVQIIDDVAGKTLFSVQTFGKNCVQGGANMETSKKVGEKVAEGLKTNKISSVVFDRNGYKYHGLVANLVNTVREKGIQI